MPSAGRRGGRRMMSGSGRLKPMAVAGRPSVTRLTHSSCAGGAGRARRGGHGAWRAGGSVGGVRVPGRSGVSGVLKQPTHCARAPPPPPARPSPQQASSRPTPCSTPIQYLAVPPCSTSQYPLQYPRPHLHRVEALWDAQQRRREDGHHLANVGGNHVANKLLGVGVDGAPSGHGSNDCGEVVVGQDLRMGRGAVRLGVSMGVGGRVAVYYVWGFGVGIGIGVGSWSWRPSGRAELG